MRAGWGRKLVHCRVGVCGCQPISPPQDLAPFSPTALLVEKWPSGIDRLILSHPDLYPTLVGSVKLNTWAYSPYVQKAIRCVIHFAYPFQVIFERGDDAGDFEHFKL